MQSTARESDIEQRIKSKSYEKLVRIHHFIDNKQHYKECKLNEILELEGDINYRMPDTGNTALHFAQSDSSSFSKGASYRRTTESLIDRGADPAVTNHKGQTVVHYTLGKYRYYRYFSVNLSIQHYISYVLSIIHVQNKNTTNFRDSYGFTHFHAACIANDSAIVSLLLNQGVSVDEAVNNDSPKYPGYTPLHFAAQHGHNELVDKLLSHGANLLKESNGKTALHMLVERNMEIVQHVNLYRIKAYNYPEIGIRINEELVLEEMEINDRIITCILLKTNKTEINRVDLFPLYVMWTLEDASLNWTENDVNKCVDVDSTFWPGYTALHFAARFDRIDTVKLLLEKGADIAVKDVHGVTPFDLCVGRFSIDDIHAIISSHNTWRNIVLSDGKTKLLDLILAMRQPEDFAQFLDGIQQDINGISIPRDSPLWPGFTILHLAVTLSKKRMHNRVKLYAPLLDDESKRVPSELIEMCLRLGADVTAQDPHGSTPIHLAFRRMDLESMYFLMERCEGKSNPTDEDNLSLLHIACAVEDVNLVKKLVACGADLDAPVSSSFQWDPEVRYFHDLSSDKHLHVWPGSTPLHTAVATNNKEIFTLLMEAGVDVNARDAMGSTPLHQLLRRSPYEDQNIVDYYDALLCRFVTKDCVVDGLSYLHIAAHRRYPKLMEKLLNLGANVNSAVVTRDRTFTDVSRNTAVMERTTEFSYFFDYYEGNTPLHMVFETCSMPRHADIPKTLVSRGADVLAKNAKGLSPIGDIVKSDCLLRDYVSVMGDGEKRLLDEMGLTELHMACQLCDEKTIEKCLGKGANANARIRDDAEVWPGFTPLHVLVMSYSPHGKDKRKREKEICRATRLLLKYGADVTIASKEKLLSLWTFAVENHIESNPAHIKILWKKVENSYANPMSEQGISHFHLACIRHDVALVEKFLKLGLADANETVDYFSNDFPGYTPLHFAVCCRTGPSLDSPPLRTINLLLEYGANANAMDLDNENPLHLASEFPSLGGLPYKRLFWAGADPQAKSLYDRTPPTDLLFNVENGETRRIFRLACCEGCSYLLCMLARPFAPCLRCLFRAYYRKVRR